MTKSKLLIALSLILIGLNFISCDDEPIDPALINTEEPNACAAPLTFESTDFIGGSSVNLSWTAAAGTGSWQIQYGPAGFSVGNGTQITATDTEATVNGLTPTTNYEFYIRTVCDAQSFSSWVGPIAVGEEIGSCPQPTNATATRSSGNTEITVSWNAATATSWQVQYGTAGFALGSGTIVSATTPTKTITGVQANVGYSFYVRTNCSPTSNSNWTGPITVAAVSVGPGPIDNSPPFMNANINGSQFNAMKPFGYNITGAQTLVSNTGAPVGESRFAWIQGTDNQYPVINEANSRQIDIRIPDTMWAVGTYTLFDNWGDADQAYVEMLLWSPTNPSAVDCSGTLEITEWNMSTRRVKANFQFTYTYIDDVVTETRTVTGNFSYALDDDYFD